MATSSGASVVLSERCIPVAQTRYLPSKEDVRKFLEGIFGRRYRLEDIRVRDAAGTMPFLGRLTRNR